MKQLPVAKFSILILNKLVGLWLESDKGYAILNSMSEKCAMYQNNYEKLNIFIYVINYKAEAINWVKKIAVYM